MAPTKALSEIKLEDIDFECIQECTDAKVLKRYLKLLEDDGNYFVDLIRACKDKLLEVAPKEYYLLYPRSTTAQEEQEAMQDILDWEASVKETDAALQRAKKDSIWDDLPQKAQWQATNVDGQNRKVTSVTSTEPRRVREGAEDALWDEVAGAKVSSDVVTNVNEVPEAHKKHMADSEKEKGNKAFYSKDYQEAEAYYSRSLQYMADDPSTWANRALVRLKLDQAQDALEDCEHALALNGSHVKALHRKGKALYELQRYKDAVRAFQEALLLSPGNSQINGDLMVARRKLRDDEAAPCTEQNGKGPKQLVDAPSIAAVPLQAGYTRVQIEEDSDSEEEEKPANAEKKGGSGGFQKIAIEEVSGSEDEEVPGRFNPPPRVAPPVTAGGFDAMD